MQTTFVITYVIPRIKRANNDMPLDHTVMKWGRDVTGRGRDARNSHLHLLPLLNNHFFRKAEGVSGDFLLDSLYG